MKKALGNIYKNDSARDARLDKKFNMDHHYAKASKAYNDYVNK